MTRFEIIISETAKRQLAGLERSVAKRIADRLELLREEPRRYVKRLAASRLYSLRVGDYRAILDIQENVWRVLVIKVGHRSTVYDR